MPSTNLSQVQEALSAFLMLDVDNRLAVLASLYKKVADAVPADAANVPTQDANNLVSKIQQLSKDEQVSALRELVTADKTGKDATMLDPNPSKALAELVTNQGTEIPTHVYAKLSVESKIAFWYTLAGKLGNGIVGIPSDYSPSQDVTRVLTYFESLNTEEIVSFLKQIV